MNLDQLIRRYSGLVMAVGGLRGATLHETAIRVFCANEILDRYEPGDLLTDADVIALGDELEMPITPDRFIAAALASGVVVRDDSNQLRVGMDIALGQVFSDLRGRMGARVSIKEYKRVFEGTLATGATELPIPSPDSCIEAVRSAHSWTNQTLIYVLDHQLEGVPCFWQCETDEHTPLFAAPGTSTTMVHLWTWLCSREFAVEGLLEHDASIVKLCESVLKLQRVGDGWERGAFSVWGADDDFSGSFEEGPDIPSGPCPTLDGTAGAVDILTTMLSIPEVRRLLSEPTVAAVKTSVAAGVEFLLRAQLNGGGWGIYRYESDIHEVVPREVSSYLAVQALTSVLRTASLDSALVSQVHSAFELYISWLENRAMYNNDLCWWLPDFTARLSNEAEWRLSTVWVCRSLLAMNEIELDETLRKRIWAMLPAALRFVTHDWTAIADASAPVEFRVPRWRGGLTPGTIAWNLPRDPLIASTVLHYLVQNGEPCPEHWWKTINHSIANVLRIQEHGHWAHYLQQREGRRYASPGFTKYCVELLLQFLGYLSFRTHPFVAEKRD